MTASKTYPVPDNILENTHLTQEQYDQMYKRSVEDPEGFWAEYASTLEWYKKPTKTKSIFFNCGDFPERKPLLMAKVSEGLMVPRPLRFSAAIAYEAKK